MLEVNRPNRQLRHQKGKSDTVDAESAARAVLSGQAASCPKSGTSSVEMIRHLKVARDTAVKGRSQAMQTLKAIIVSAPAALREQLDAIQGKMTGIATGTAADMLLLVGDNPERIKSEAAFAKMCGACPIPASSGKTNRHRLNRGGNRQANAALYRVVIVRMRGHQRTVDYVRRRTAEGRSKSEIIRCLKRYVAREIFGYLRNPPKTASAATNAP